MLSRRLSLTGLPYLELNQIQRDMKQAIDRKVREGTYRFETVACALCEGTSFQSISSRDRYGLHVPVAACKACGLVQTNPRMSLYSYREFYNLEYRNLYGGGRPEHSTPEGFFEWNYSQNGPPLYRYLSERGNLPDRPGALVLEVGCAAGGILHYFREQGFRVKGIDLGEEFLDYGRTRHGLDLHVGTLDDLRMSEAPSLILYRHVFEHILDLRAELAALRAIADEKTRVYIEVPGIKWLDHSYQGDLLRCFQNAHVYYFSLATLQGILAKNGFRMLDGNERIQSIFARSDDLEPTECPNDYALVMAYLKEKERQWNRKRVPKLLRKAAQRAKRALQEWSGARPADDRCRC